MTANVSVVVIVLAAVLVLPGSCLKVRPDKPDIAPTATKEDSASALLKRRENQSPNSTAAYHQALAKVKPYTMVADAKLWQIWDAVEKLNQLGVPGDIVEAGVWKGGASMLMAMSQLRTWKAGLNRHAWLYDTYEGLPPPTSEKDDPSAKAAYQRIKNGTMTEQEKQQHYVEDGKWCYGSFELVQQNMISTGFPAEAIHMVKGKVEDTLVVPQNLPAQIAVLRLDTDWYDSTKAELAYLLPRLMPGGLLIIDDYCAWQGSRQAANEMLNPAEWPTLVTSGELCAHAWKSWCQQHTPNCA